MHPPFLSYQGDAGETGEPGLQGEVGPPVSNLIILSPVLHDKNKQKMKKYLVYYENFFFVYYLQ